MATKIFEEFLAFMNDTNPHFDVKILLTPLLIHGVIGPEDNAAVSQLSSTATRATELCLRILPFKGEKQHKGFVRVLKTNNYTGLSNFIEPKIIGYWKSQNNQGNPNPSVLLPATYGQTPTAHKTILLGLETRNIIYKEFAKNLPTDYAVEPIIAMLTVRGVITASERALIEHEKDPLTKFWKLFVQFMPPKDADCHRGLIKAFSDTSQKENADYLSRNLFVESD